MLPWNSVQTFVVFRGWILTLVLSWLCIKHCQQQVKAVTYSLKTNHQQYRLSWNLTFMVPRGETFWLLWSPNHSYFSTWSASLTFYLASSKGKSVHLFHSNLLTTVFIVNWNLVQILFSLYLNLYLASFQFVEGYLHSWRHSHQPQL